MLQASYVNSINQKIEFGKNGLYINESDLHDYEWAYGTSHNKITYFNTQIFEKGIPIVIVSQSKAERNEIANNLFKVVDYDVVNRKPGKLWIGDWYLQGYFMAAGSSGYSNDNTISIKLKFVSDMLWRKETSYYFTNRGTVNDLDFNYDHDYDLKRPVSHKIQNTNYVDTDFRIVIHGTANNPTVYIGENLYSVEVVIPDKNRLVIDSVNKTIKAYTEFGVETNCFAYRNKDWYIFEKIKPGTNEVDWDGNYAVEVVLIEQRSEPEWI